MNERGHRRRSLRARLAASTDGAGIRQRDPAVAGLFYPADARELSATIDRELDAARSRRPDPKTTSGAKATKATKATKAIIAPHAGYIYSGPVAASAYVSLTARPDRVRRVVILGPAHRAALTGMAIPTVDGLATPLGVVPIDDSGRQILSDQLGVSIDDAPHRREHSLEVHLPFFQRLLSGPWSTVPILVGDAEPESVADAIDSMWGDDETVIVVSSDLSHYHDQASAAVIDRETAQLITDRRSADLDPSRACGAIVVAGLLLVANRRTLDVDLLDLRTSADTAGSPDRVVGYGAFAVA